MFSFERRALACWTCGKEYCSSQNHTESDSCVECGWPTCNACSGSWPPDSVLLRVLPRPHAQRCPGRPMDCSFTAAQMQALRCRSGDVRSWQARRCRVLMRCRFCAVMVDCGNVPSCAICLMRPCMNMILSSINIHFSFYFGWFCIPGIGPFGLPRDSVQLADVNWSIYFTAS